jgi:hypothetical protein
MPLEGKGLALFLLMPFGDLDEDQGSEPYDKSKNCYNIEIHDLLLWV